MFLRVWRFSKRNSSIYREVYKSLTKLLQTLKVKRLQMLIGKFRLEFKQFSRMIFKSCESSMTCWGFLSIYTSECPGNKHLFNKIILVINIHFNENNPDSNCWIQFDEHAIIICRWSLIKISKCKYFATHLLTHLIFTQNAYTTAEMSATAIYCYICEFVSVWKSSRWCSILLKELVAIQPIICSFRRSKYCIIALIVKTSLASF